MRKIPILIFLIIFIVLIGIYKLAGFIFGIGLSFPPNYCDLKIGHEIRGDLIFSSRDLCLQRLAEETLNPRICKNISWSPNVCLRSLAIKMEDPAICLELPNSESYRTSIDSDRDDCLVYYARSVPDESACQIIEDKYNKGQCYLAVTSSVAKENNNLQYCFKNINDLLIYECIKIAASNKADCDTNVRRIFSGKDWHQYLGKSLDYAIDECVREKNTL